MMRTVSLLTALNFTKIGISRVILPRISFCYRGPNTLLTSSFFKAVTVPAFNSKRLLCSDDKSHEKQKPNDTVIGSSVSESGKYEVFKDENASLVLDVIEERQRIHDLEDIEEYDEFAGLNLERGLTGVIDIEDLVEVLRRENANDIFVAKVPSHLQYVDYIVVVSGKSLKHMLGLAEFIRKFYKAKRHKNDLIPRLEGETSKDWFALDLGNIALHIMSKSARPDYDLESLWAVGKEYDEKSNNDVDPLVEILKKHSINLDDFQPADNYR